MKILPRIFLALLFAAVHVPARASDFVAIGNARSEIKIDKTQTEECSEYVNFVETFSRFTLFKYDWEQKKYYLIKQDFALGQGCFEGFNPQRVTVTANPLNQASGVVANTVAWRFATDGASGGVADYPFAGLYKIDMPGCCAAAPVAKYFSLRSGKFIMASTIRPLMLDLIEQRAQRYIGIEDNTAAARWGNVKNIATIFLGDNAANLQMIAIHSADTVFDGEEWMATQLNFVGQDANEQTHSVFKNAAVPALRIVLACRCERPELTLTVPLDANRIDNKHATITGANGIVLDNISLPTTAAN
jgi:hypothetical protein